MDALINAFFADPMYYLGFCFAFAAALAFLTFLRGFLSGMPNFFTISAHEGHQQLHRYHVVRGVTALFALILAWETVRTIAAWFGIGTAPPHALWTLWAGYIILGLVLWALFAVKSAITDKDH